MTERQHDLGSSELEVLKALWDHGPSTVRDVLNHLHEQGRKLAYTTVLTFLTRLEQKGFVVSDKTNLAYVYRAGVSRDRITRSRLKALVEDFFNGATGQLALQLVRTSKFTPAEIAELQKVIEQLEMKRGRNG